MDAEKFKWDWGKHTGLSWLRDPIDRLFELLTKIQPLAGQGLGADDTSQGRMLHTTGGSGGSVSVVPANDYSFKISDASDTEGEAKVLILDGVIWGPNDSDSVSPDGMPSEDTYELVVNDNDEIWVEVDWLGSDPETIVSASIANGPTTPDDTESTSYITIGYVSVDDSSAIPRVFPANQHCGDIIIQLPPYPDSDSFVLMAKDGALIWEETDTCAQMAVFLKDGKVLLTADGKVATSTDCCCGGTTGGCCIDGVCSILSVADCASGGGNYLGDGSTCSGVDCTMGACCTLSGCAFLSLESCALITPSNFLGGSICVPNPCSGSCCLCDTSCIDDISSADCVATGLSTFWRPFFADVQDCSTLVCGECAGACCNRDTGDCSLETRTTCIAVGSPFEFLGYRTTCDACEATSTGACCNYLDSSCTITTSPDCTCDACLWIGADTTCPGACGFSAFNDPFFQNN